MSRVTQFAASFTFASTILAGPALADLTAQEVWNSLESAMTRFGYAVAATERPQSDGLDVADVELKFDVPDENSAFSIMVKMIDLVENDDGSVTMSFPQSMPITLDIAPEGEDDVTMVLDYSNSGLEIVVSGDASNMSYAFDADEIAVALAELTVNGEAINRDEARFEFVVTALSGMTSIGMGPDTKITQSMRADSAGYDVAFNDPDSNDAALVTGSMSDLVIESTSILPEGFDPSNPQSLAAGGFSASGKMSYAMGDMDFGVTESAGTTNGKTSSGSAALEFEVTDEMVRYDVVVTDQEIEISGPELPVPVTFRTSDGAFNVTVPIAAADAPQDLDFGVTIGGFEMSELLWNMFDPGAALPRDPAMIVFDLSGQVTPFVNLFDPASMAQLDATGGVPGELNSLTLNNLTVEAAGAKLGGNGAFTFDNQDMQTFGGFPRPNGQVDLSLDGVNGLIDKLIAMGVLTNEDAMGARMMMSMFAVPGDGPDSLRSSIQINDQGHILANGMRIQ